MVMLVVVLAGVLACAFIPTGWFDPRDPRG
ncbi:hypothetical protein LABOLPEG_00031 [Pseudomonas phage phi 21A]|nr:hypothetical protein LABOLPEG_00031 [Pseudomonas phage phi 21A]